MSVTGCDCDVMSVTVSDGDVMSLLHDVMVVWVVSVTGCYGNLCDVCCRI